MSEQGKKLSKRAMKAACAIPSLEHSNKEHCAIIIDQATGLPTLLRQQKALVKLVEYARKWVPRGEAVSVQSANWHYDAQKTLAECKEPT